MPGPDILCPPPLPTWLLPVLSKHQQQLNRSSTGLPPLLVLMRAWCTGNAGTGPYSAVGFSYGDTAQDSDSDSSSSGSGSDDSDDGKDPHTLEEVRQPGPRAQSHQLPSLLR